MECQTEENSLLNWSFRSWSLVLTAAAAGDWHDDYDNSSLITGQDEEQEKATGDMTGVSEMEAR